MRQTTNSQEWTNKMLNTSVFLQESGLQLQVDFWDRLGSQEGQDSHFPSTCFQASHLPFGQLVWILDEKDLGLFTTHALIPTSLLPDPGLETEGTLVSIFS